MTKISLVMATKNPKKVQDYIKQALSLSSLFDEVIVHNNSPENSYYIPKYENLKIINDYDLVSSGKAFNKAIEESTGDWILTLCDDDFCDYVKIKELITEIKNNTFNSCDIIVCPFYIGNEARGWQFWPRVEITLDKLKEHNLLPFTSFYKKSVWQDVKGYKNVQFCDWFFWLEACKKGKLFQLCNIAYFYFRQGHLSEPSLSDQETMKQPFELTRLQLLDYLEKSSC